MAYTKKDKEIIKKLTDAGVELSGEETSDDLKTLLKDNLDEEEETEQEVIPGVPNKIAPVFEPLPAGSKEKPFALHHVMAVKGGFAMYNHLGQRISPLLVPGTPLAGTPDGEKGTDEVAYHRKAAANMNAQRKARRLPNDKE